MVSASTWYFSHGSDSVGNAEVRLGFEWTYKVNFGTLCYGSGIMAVIQVIRNAINNARDK